MFFRTFQFMFRLENDNRCIWGRLFVPISRMASTSDNGRWMAHVHSAAHEIENGVDLIRMVMKAYLQISIFKSREMRLKLRRMATFLEIPRPKKK